MAIQDSGTISILDIKNEFGGSGSHSLSEYYRGGRNSTVPDNDKNDSIPKSGAIAISDFYGTNNNKSNQFIASSFDSLGTSSTINPSTLWDGSPMNSLSIQSDGRVLLMLTGLHSENKIKSLLVNGIFLNSNSAGYEFFGDFLGNTVWLWSNTGFSKATGSKEFWLYEKLDNNQ
jgi:hypothetical protein